MKTLAQLPRRHEHYRSDASGQARLRFLPSENFLQQRKGVGRRLSGPCPRPHLSKFGSRFVRFLQKTNVAIIVKIQIQIQIQKKNICCVTRIYIERTHTLQQSNMHTNLPGTIRGRLYIHANTRTVLTFPDRNGTKQHKLTSRSFPLERQRDTDALCVQGRVYTHTNLISPARKNNNKYVGGRRQDYQIQSDNEALPSRVYSV